MSKDKGNHEVMKSMHSETLEALRLLKDVREVAQRKVKSQGTAIWLTQKVNAAIAHVQKVADSISKIDPALADTPAIAADPGAPV